MGPAHASSHGGGKVGDYKNRMVSLIRLAQQPGLVAPEPSIEVTLVVEQGAEMDGFGGRRFLEGRRFSEGRITIPETNRAAPLKMAG